MSATKTNCSAFITTVITAIVLISMSAYAFEPGNNRQGKKEGFFRALNILDLSEDQKGSIQNIREQTKDSIQPLREQIENIELLSAILAESINTEDVNQKIEQIQELKSDICQIMMNAKLEIAQVLTSQQRVELLAFMEKMKKLRDGLKNKRGPRNNGF